MRHGNPALHPDLKAARRAEAAAGSAFRRKARELQATCEHPFVLHSDGSTSESFGRSLSVRVCPVCGLAEYSRWGSTGRWPSGGLTNRYGSETSYSRLSVFKDKPIKVVSSDHAYRCINTC